MALATSIELISKCGSPASSSASRPPRPGSRSRAGDLKAAGAMALLLKDALKPNLVQTLEGGPALVHCGPFGNIAHGCNCGPRDPGRRSALRGPGADRSRIRRGPGCREVPGHQVPDSGASNPEAAVLVATVRALKLNGGANKGDLKNEDLSALERGLPNLEKHIENVTQFGVPVVVAKSIASPPTPTREINAVADRARRAGARVALNEVWEKGGAGDRGWPRRSCAMLAAGGAKYAPLYPVRSPDPAEDRYHREKGVRRTASISQRQGGPHHRLPRRGVRSPWQTPCASRRRSTRSRTMRRSFGARPASASPSTRCITPRAPASSLPKRGISLTMPGLPKESLAERMASNT